MDAEQALAKLFVGALKRGGTGLAFDVMLIWVGKGFVETSDEYKTALKQDFIFWTGGGMVVAGTLDLIRRLLFLSPRPSASKSGST